MRVRNLRFGRGLRVQNRVVTWEDSSSVIAVLRLCGFAEELTLNGIKALHYGQLNAGKSENCCTTSKAGLLTITLDRSQIIDVVRLRFCRKMASLPCHSPPPNPTSLHSRQSIWKRRNRRLFRWNPAKSHHPRNGFWRIRSPFLRYSRSET